MYAQAFEAWRVIAEGSSSNAMEPERIEALQRLQAKKDLELIQYYEVYDQDQREAFSDVST